MGLDGDVPPGPSDIKLCFELRQREGWGLWLVMAGRGCAFGEEEKELTFWLGENCRLRGYKRAYEILHDTQCCMKRW